MISGWVMTYHLDGEVMSLPFCLNSVLHQEQQKKRQDVTFGVRDLVRFTTQLPSACVRCRTLIRIRMGNSSDTFSPLFLLNTVFLSAHLSRGSLSLFLPFVSLTFNKIKYYGSILHLTRGKKKISGAGRFNTWYQQQTFYLLNFCWNNRMKLPVGELFSNC